MVVILAISKGRIEFLEKSNLQWKSFLNEGKKLLEWAKTSHRREERIGIRLLKYSSLKKKRKKAHY